MTTTVARKSGNPNVTNEKNKVGVQHYSQGSWGGSKGNGGEFCWRSRPDCDVSEGSEDDEHKRDLSARKQLEKLSKANPMLYILDASGKST